MSWNPGNKCSPLDAKHHNSSTSLTAPFVLYFWNAFVQIATTLHILEQLRNFFGCYCSSQSNLAFLQAERNYTSSSKDQKSGVVSNSALQELKMFPGRTDLSFLPWVGRLRNGGAYTVIGRTHSPFSLFSTRSGCSYLEKREARITHSVSCRRLGRYSHFRATDDTLNKVKQIK